MKMVVQRVKKAKVEINGKKKSQIGFGLLIFLGICNKDTTEDIDYLTSKLVKLRIFDDKDGVMNLSAIDINAEMLVVSQFTLYAQIQRGNRPSYIDAAKPEISKPLYDLFCISLSEKLNREVKTGVFGADMQVTLSNDGPVTIIAESKKT